MQPSSTWIIATLLALLIVALAWRMRALNASGAIAAVLLGTVVVGSGGWWPGIILVTFFVTSSLLSRIGRDTDQARGSRRDWVQVLANGWPILIGSIVYAVTGNDIWLLFGVGGIAAATADTWSSELGKLSTSPPRLIMNGECVPPGTSGAISLVGTLASIAGAMLIGALAGFAYGIGTFIGITIAGIVGGLVDSLLGATVQERRYCDTCDKPTEANPHRCGNPTRFVGGIRFINNDVVNMACVFSGAIIGTLSGIL